MKKKEQPSLVELIKASIDITVQYLEIYASSERSTPGFTEKLFPDYKKVSEYYNMIGTMLLSVKGI